MEKSVFSIVVGEEYQLSRMELVFSTQLKEGEYKQQDKQFLVGGKFAAFHVMYELDNANVSYVYCQYSEEDKQYDEFYGVKVKTVIMSHLSDMQFTGTFNSEIANFIKYLLIQYPDTSVEINPDKSWSNFQAKSKK